MRLSVAGLIRSVSIVYREDLDLKNHLAGHQRKLMKIAFDNTQALMDVRNELVPTIARNRANAKRSDAYSVLTSLSSSSAASASASVRFSASREL
jgi:DNA polymerase epsilon subunit 1